ncbi:hypothetical protein ABIE45_001251 [Methylobacterium sp. OAE515]|uniref:hypothetical protein n=1 Tax=Methylobacterium sp. OAE515 TaxID=2817895 RepID=UPI00178B5017
MEAKALAVLSLQVEICPEDSSRYRWVIRDQDCILRQCLYSLSDEQTALRQGEAALQEMAALWRDAQ